MMLVTSAATVTILCFACVSGLGRARGGGWGVSGGIRGGDSNICYLILRGF